MGLPLHSAGIVGRRKFTVITWRLGRILLRLGRITGSLRVILWRLPVNVAMGNGRSVLFSQHLLHRAIAADDDVQPPAQLLLAHTVDAVDADDLRRLLV